MRPVCVQVAWQTSKPPVLFVLPSIRFSGSWLILFLLFVLFFCMGCLLLIHLFQRWYFGLFCASSPMLCCATFFLSTALCCLMVCFAPCCSVLWFYFTVVHLELCSWLALYCLKRQMSSNGAFWQKRITIALVAILNAYLYTNFFKHWDTIIV